MRRRAALFFVLAFCATVALGELAVPHLSGRVNDYADLIPADAEARLEGRLSELERDTGAQLAILTLPSLEDEPLEDYSIRVVEQWQLGREGIDDGVLILVSRDDRKLRIEVGYGLEPTLTDIASKRIISNLMVPRFREGDFAGGIEAAVAAIDGTVRGQEGLIPPEPSGRELAGAGKLGTLVVSLIVLGFFSLMAAASSGCASWFLYVFLMPFYYAFPAAALGHPVGLVALILWILLFPVLQRLMKSDRVMTSGSRGWSSRGWRGGFGGGGFSGGFGGGGFSGGGGSFGGGGASGSW